jgi:hypothetical protein
MAGLLVDVYGLLELAPSATQISCLWMHHPRTRRKEDMAGIAGRCVGAWNAAVSSSSSSSSGQPGDGGHGGKRGLIALVYDQRNHGSRVVDEKANGSWREGNAMHAVDMFGAVQGMVADQRVLL